MSRKVYYDDDVENNVYSCHVMSGQVRSYHDGHPSNQGVDQLVLLFLLSSSLSGIILPFQIPLLDLAGWLRNKNLCKKVIYWKGVQKQ